MDDFDTDSIIDFCWTNSLDSIRKSFPAYLSLTLYGNVFLIKLELLKSNDWFKDKLSFT